MPSWLILILVGVVLVILGVATNIGQFLIWIGVIVLVVSLILGLVGRGRRSVGSGGDPRRARVVAADQRQLQGVDVVGDQFEGFPIAPGVGLAGGGEHA